jgi:hypothetical protein
MARACDNSVPEIWCNVSDDLQQPLKRRMPMQKLSRAENKRRAHVLGLIGMDDMPKQFIEAISDAMRVEFRRRDNDEEEFCAYCSAEWHFARFHGDGSELCAALYNMALHIAGEGGVFFFSVPNLARYFDTSTHRVREALHLLADSQFFELPPKIRKGETVRYRPVTHKTWSERHPGMCCRKESLPDYMQGDPLGRVLWGISGGKMKFFPEWLDHLRKFANDAAIEQAFRIFADGERVPGAFNFKQAAFKRFAHQVRKQYPKTSSDPLPKDAGVPLAEK